MVWEDDILILSSDRLEIYCMDMEVPSVQVQRTEDSSDRYSTTPCMAAAFI
jgi:hypothetical protein